MIEIVNVILCLLLASLLLTVWLVVVGICGCVLVMIINFIRSNW